MSARNVAVMGAGTMGSGIAAHLANLGFEVTLFDLTRESVQAGYDRALRTRPPHFYNHEAANRVRLASLSDDLVLVREADWVCEAIIESLDAKQELYAALEPVLREDAMISTNTSGLEIRLLCDGRSESFKKRFLGTHFFNPPRYLKLVELIPTSETDAATVAAMTTFLEDRVGKRVVACKDTPGFIANRYGMWVLFQAIHTAEKLGFSVERVDALTGPFIGRPRTGTFRLADLIGLDIMADVASNLNRRCPEDPRRNNLRLPKSVETLIEQGRLGAKTGQGYYKKEGDQFLSLEFANGNYRPRAEPDLPKLSESSKLPLGERLRKTLEQSGEEGEFLREHLIPALVYATEVAEEISYSVRDFDDVMRWGWGWEAGPFEAMDAVGADFIKKFSPVHRLTDKAPFYEVGNALDFRTMEREPAKKDKRFAKVADFAITTSGEHYLIREDGEGGFIFEFKSKMNALNPGIVAALIELATLPTARITLVNDGRSFSAGYDLKTILQLAEDERFEEMRGHLTALQACGFALKNARSSAGLQGFALGGGLELAMHCNIVVSSPEATLGLPEVQVGLIPAGGGTTMLRMRSQGDLRAMAAAAAQLCAGRRVLAADGVKSLFLRSTDKLAVNPDRLVFDALSAEQPLSKSAEWQPAPAPLAGMIDSEIEKLRASGEIGEYGVQIAGEIKQIFVRAKNEEHSYELEVEAFLRLMGKPRTQLRIKHMLEYGKPLNN